MDPNPINPQQPIQPEIPQNSKFSFFKSAKVWPIIVLLILLIPTGTYLLGKNQSSKQISTIQSSPTPTPTPDPTANWKTYSDSKYGFSLKYPSEYLISEVNNGIFFSKSPEEKVKLDACLKQIECNSFSLGIQFTSGSKPTEQSLKDYIIKHDSGDFYTWDSKAIDGSNALQTEYDAVVGSGKINVTYVVKGTSVLRIQTQTENISIYNQILSTFKFTDPAANWKIYSGKYLSFKYPPNWKPVKPNEGGEIIDSSTLNLTDFGHIQSGALIYEPYTLGIIRSWDIDFKNLSSGENLTIDGQQAELRINKRINVSSATVRYAFSKTNEFGQYSYISLLSNPSEFDANLAIFKQILSTFKFTQ